MDNKPLVSVLMTAYNREKYIKEAIESVLASTYINFELIIVDDGSKDKTVQIAQSFASNDARIKVFENEKNLGDYSNRNKAASLAKGKYIKYIDSDDVIYSWALEVMVSAMEKFPEAGFGLSSHCSLEKPFPVCTNPTETYLEHFFGYGHFDRAPGSSIINRQIFNELKGFSGKDLIGDQEFWFKIARYYPMVKFPMDLYWNRLHTEQQTQFEIDNRTHFQKLRSDIIENALLHADIPLSKEQIGSIRKKMSKKRIKKHFIKYVSRYFK